MLSDGYSLDFYFHTSYVFQFKIVGNLHDQEVDQEVACSTSERQGWNFVSCVCRAVASHSSHHPQEVILAHFSLHLHKGGLKPHSFHLCCPMIRYVVNENSEQNVKRQHIFD